MTDFSENPFTALNSEDAFESLNNAKQSRGISDKNKHYLDNILHRVTEAHKKNVEVNLDAPKSVVIDIEDETDAGHEETDKFDDSYAADLAAMNDVLVDDDDGFEPELTGFEFDQAEFDDTQFDDTQFDDTQFDDTQFDDTEFEQTEADEDLLGVDSDYINDDQDIEEMVSMNAENLPVGVARIVSAWSKASRIEREVAKRRMGLVDRATMSRETDRLVLLALGDAKQQGELSSPEATRVTDLEAELVRTREMLKAAEQKIEELRQQIDVEIEQTAARADVSAGVQELGTVPGVVKTYQGDDAGDEVEAASSAVSGVVSEPDATPVATADSSAGLSMFGDDDDDDDDEDVVSPDLTVDGGEATEVSEDTEAAEVTEVIEDSEDDDFEDDEDAEEEAFLVDEVVDEEELAMDEIPDDIPEFEDPEPEVDFPDDDDIPDDIPDQN